MKNSHQVVRCILGLHLLCCPWLLADSVYSQVIPDTTLPTPSEVTSNNSLDFTVVGGTRAGGNLFHSFDTFSIPASGSVLFENGLDVQNIISRVTGSLSSDIDGLLTTNSFANVLLINPNGIQFGPNARLEIGGAFLATTANSLHFAGSEEFRVSPSQTSPILSITTPIGLQFGSTARPIVVDGSVLTVAPGNALALLGGNVTLVGGDLDLETLTLGAPGGSIEIGSVAPNNFVNLRQIDRMIDLTYSGVQNFQDISLSQLAILDATDLPELGVDEIGSGTIQLQGRTITLSGGSQISSITLGDFDAGSITLNATDAVEIIGFGITSIGVVSTNVNTLTLGRGSSGSIVINTSDLYLRDGAAIASSASRIPGLPNSGKGKTGDINILASDSIELEGGVEEVGAPGITIETFDADGGELTIQTSRLLVSDGANISGTTFGAGQGGSLRITASELIEISGQDVNQNFTPTTVSVSSEDFPFDNDFTPVTGPAGDLIIKTNQLRVFDGAEINSSGLSAGDAGLLSIEANTISLDQGNLTAATNFSDGGIISLDVSELLVLQNSSRISATAGQSTPGQGDGGIVEINAGTIAAVPGSDSDITADANQGQGGRITLTTQGVFGLVERESIAGNGTNDIDASSDFGLAGVVSINTPETDPSKGLIKLPVELLNPATQIAQACPGLVGEMGEAGQFLITGRGGLQSNPYNWLSVDAVSTNWVTHNDQSTSPNTQLKSPKNNVTVPDKTVKIVEAQGWHKTIDGYLLLTAEPQAAQAQLAGSSHNTCQS